MALTKYKLGELIEQRREKYDNVSDLPIRGVSREGFIDAKQPGADLSLYNVFYYGDFVFNPARMELNSIAYNCFYDKAICSSLYEIFYVSRKDILLPEYLNMFVKRDEFARLCEFLGWGSAREYCRVSNLIDVEITLPDIEQQRKYVDVYLALQNNLAAYQSKVDELKTVCDGYIEELRRNMKCEKLSHYIKEENLRNTDNSLNNVLGVCKEKTFISTIANLHGIQLTNYKVVRPGWFAYSNRINIGSIALRYGTPCLVSPSYTVFSVDEKHIIPEYIVLWLQREEFLHFAFFYSMGTVKDELGVEDLGQMEIPIPDLQTQSYILDIYNVYKERKTIAAKLKEQLNKLCPILIKGSLQTVN